jgi:hypothetical protein
VRKKPKKPKKPKKCKIKADPHTGESFDTCDLCQKCVDGACVPAEGGEGECGVCEGGEILKIGCLNPCEECNDVYQCAPIPGAEEQCGDKCCKQDQVCTNGQCCPLCAGPVCQEGPGKDGCPVCQEPGKVCCCGRGPVGGACAGYVTLIPLGVFCCGGAGGCEDDKCCTTSVSDRAEMTCKECNFPVDP